MYVNCAYLNNSAEDFEDKSGPLLVGSCGTYRLYTRPEFLTCRPKGRVDYQLLYIASGKAHFFIDGKDRIVTAGHMVLYRPKEMQKYIYYGSDQTEVYWVHFTGGNVRNILRQYGMNDDLKIFYSGALLEYQHIYRKMIQELQMCKEDYQELLTILLRQLFILIHRQLNTCIKVKDGFLTEEIDLASTYFNEHYNEEISVEEYAASRHMSVSWFIRAFKQYIGITPMQYVLSIRIANAQNLLEATDYNITEISNMVGYDNPLYFSRIFKKQRGLSPSEYRKHIKEKTKQE